MPTNRFPDSRSKRELRRRDARRLRAFQDAKNLSLGLTYCGMPSVEFLDVQAWQNSLSSICAVEYDPETLSDMRIQWDSIGLKLPIRFVNDDIIDFLCTNNDHYDLYNLDFYGGLLNPTSIGTSRCIDAIKNLIHKQSMRKQSFVLIATFNVRDRGIKEYLEFISEVPKILSSWRNIETCCSAHKKNQATRLKLCFTYLCWQLGLTSSFSVWFAEPIVYQSTATLIHFYAEFTFQERSLPDLTSHEVLADLISMPLIRLEGMIPKAELMPMCVEKP